MKHFLPKARLSLALLAVFAAVWPAGAPAQPVPLPQNPPQEKRDSIGALIQNETGIEQQIIDSGSSFANEPLGKAPLAPKQGFISPPVPRPAPVSRLAPRSLPASQPHNLALPETGESAAPVFTTPVPIPVPMPVPEPAPLSAPDDSDLVAPQAEPYTAAPQAPLTYPQEPRASGGFPRFGDRKPHVWASRRKPWHYAIHGTDVSWHNQTINWSALARGRISFVFIKATEGGDHIDPAFQQNRLAAKAAGLAQGAYHFYYFCRPVQDQLQWYIKNVPRDKYSMPPVLDIEWNHTSLTCRRRPPPAVVRKDMRIFLQGVEKHYGKKPIIYTTVDFFHDNNLSTLRNYPFWLRSVAAHPDDRYKKHPWLFWQYTGTGRVPGISGDADINVFVGSAKQWRSWLRAVRR